MGKKEKILIYNHTFFSISQTFVYQQASDLEKKYEVHLVSRDFRNPHGFDMDKFVIHQIKHPVSFVDRVFGRLLREIYKMNIVLDMESYFKLRSLFKKNSFKAMHVHFGDNAVEILGLAKLFKIPLVVTFHGHDAAKLLKKEEYKSQLRGLFDYASAIIIVSGHMIDSLELQPWMDKVHLIPCSVNPENFRMNNVEKKSDKIKIAHTGRIVSTKGVPDLVKVFSALADQYDNIELHVAGDGDELEKCRQLASSLGHENRITFYGRVSQEEVKKLLNEADIFVLNSRTDHEDNKEGTPVSILEAMSVGDAVVSTVHAGIPYVIEHGENGLLANEYDNDELKNCLKKFIDDPALRKKLGVEAKKTVEKSYTNQVMQEKINKVFETI